MANHLPKRLFIGRVELDRRVQGARRLLRTDRGSHHLIGREGGQVGSPSAPPISGLCPRWMTLRATARKKRVSSLTSKADEAALTAMKA